MKLGDPFAGTRRKANAMNLFAAAQAFRHEFAQVLEAFSGYGRDRHHVLAAPRFLVEPLTLFLRYEINLVPRLDPQGSPLFRKAKRTKDVLDIFLLRLAVRVSHVADMDQEI